MATINGTAANNSLSGTALNDDIHGFDGNDTLYGQAGDDILDGGNGNDLLNGGTGADAMSGGDGNDTIVVDNVGDAVSGGNGIDLVQVTLAAGEYDMSVVATDVENATAMGATLVNIKGNGLDNVLTGNSAGNQLRGEAGNDTLDGGAGVDYMAGGVGNDTYVVDNIGDTVSEVGGGGIDLVQVKFASGIYTLGTDIENGQIMASSAAGITGNDLANYLTGSSGANTISGGIGNDTLDGGLGNDKLTGGVGDDTYIVNAAGDVIVEAAGEGADHVQVAFTTAGTYVLSDNIETAAITSSAQGVNITGNFQANLLTGSAGNNALAGGGGNDTLDGGAGNDTLDGGAGIDRAIISGNFGDYVITAAATSTTGDIQLKGNGQTLIIRGLEILQFSDGDKNVADLSIPTNGDDYLTMTGGTINALAGNDIVIGSAGNDTIDGGKGNDLMVGGLGDDTYYVDSLLDSPVENPAGGDDKVYLSVASGTYVLPTEVEWAQVTSTGAVNITGHNGASNHLIGGSGTNVLKGGDQNDTLDGGLGNDTLVGGAGDDTYWVSAAGDSIVENATEGTDTVFVKFTAAGTYALSGNVENAFADTGAVNVSITGNNLNNTVQGNDGNNLLNGGDGNDTLLGSLGNDTLDGGGGSLDMVDLSAYGTSANWTAARISATDIKLTYTGAPNTSVTLRNVEFVHFSDVDTSPVELLGNASTQLADNLYLTIQGSLDGGAGNDTLHGSAAGNDTLIGGTGNDLMFGLGGNDTYYVDSAADIVVENADDGGALDRVFVTMTTGTYALGVGNHVEIGIIQSTGAVNLTGNELNNSLMGGIGANILVGGAGDDTISGSLGADVLTGGAGGDEFVFDTTFSSANVDKITDFVQGEDHITINLSGTPYGGVLGGSDLLITASTYFRYNPGTGALMFDADGFGTGVASVNIAVLGTTTHPAFLLDGDVTILP